MIAKLTVETPGDLPCGPTRPTMADMTREDLGDGAWLELAERWLDPADASTLMARMVATLPLRTELVTVFGKQRPQPRLTAWHADPQCVYRYSGLELEPSPWTPELASMRDRLTNELGVPFNSVLVNLYRDGADSMGWHADDERAFGESPTIASVSLGAPRRFALRHRKTRKTREFSLGGGSLLVMGGTIQNGWQHAVPKTTRTVGSRLNLTWRWFR